MPVRFAINGINFEADTVAEAVELQKLLTTQSKSSSNGTKAPAPQAGKDSSPRSAKETPRAPSTSISDKPDYRRLFEELNENGKTVIRGLVEAHPNRLNTQGLSGKTGISSMQLPPIFKHIRKIARESGIDSDVAISRINVAMEGKVISMYSLSEEFVEGWRGVKG